MNHRMNTRAAIGALATAGAMVGTLLFLGACVAPQAEVKSPKAEVKKELPRVNMAGSGFAAKGFDLVSYFSDSAAVEGNSEFVAEHGGHSYQFSSPENRDAFTAEPGKYLPQYGGYCAYGMASGHRVDVDPQSFTIVEGKLYLNLNPSIQQRWRFDPAAFIKKADGHWAQ